MVNKRTMYRDIQHYARIKDAKKLTGSGGLPIRQSRQLPKVQHGAEARKAPKVDFQTLFQSL